MSDRSRVHPFDLLFGAFREERFPAILAALGERDGVDDFMLAQPALALMQELRPDEGLGEAVDDFVALVHAAYRFWRDGEATLNLDEGATRTLTLPPPERSSLSRAEPGKGPPGLRRAETTYVQLAPRIVWGQLAAAAPFEPLDGWFALPGSGEALRMVACFGVHPERPGVSVVALEGVQPTALTRPDGTPLFAPTMSGGDAAGLHAVNGPEELLLLGWRSASGREA